MDSGISVINSWLITLQIDTIENLKVLKKYTFSDLYIQGNPVTQLVNYVTELRQMFPTLSKIVSDEIYIA